MDPPLALKGGNAASNIEDLTHEGQPEDRLVLTFTYTWDDFNRLTAVSATDASKNQTHTFGVNGFRRKKKDKNDVETTEYAAGLATAVSKAQAGDTVTYLMGPQIMGLQRESDGAMFWFITDALSTVRDVVDSSGTVVASYEFSEYGQKISPANTGGVESQKTFVGGLSVQDEVADTGLMLMGHRFYDPGLLGRFLNRDPIGYAGGLNLLEYGRSSPAHFTDPIGLKVGDFDDPLANLAYLNRQADLAVDRGDWAEATFLRTLGVFLSQSGATVAQEAGEGWGSGTATTLDTVYYGVVLASSPFVVGNAHSAQFNALARTNSGRLTLCQSTVYLNRLKFSEDIIQAGRTGKNIPLSSAANTAFKTRGGNIVIYGPDGIKLAQISSARIKAILFNIDPNGVKRFFDQKTPVTQSILDIFGL